MDYDEIVLDDATPRTLALGSAPLLRGTPIGKPGNVIPAAIGQVGFVPSRKLLR